MEADLSAHSTFLTPDMFVNRADSPLTTIKMEDLQQIPATPVVDPELLSVDTPRPATNESKPTKKRKSWGQVLPEPKTSLPPRKRAKTADEKEQRRIERVKRNRLAAHNSRERKRQETENLQGINDALERRVKALEEQNKKMAAELRTYRHIVGSVAPPSLESFDFIAPVEAFDAASPDTINPLQASASTPGTMTDMDTPVDSATQPSTPFAEATATEPDQTQHSAAMLWDLQCQSGSASQQAPNASQRFRWPASFAGDLPLEHFFDLDSLVDPGAAADPLLPPQQGFFDDEFLPDPADPPAVGPFDLAEQFDDTLFDLHAGSGATFVSDELGYAAMV